ncbi:DNA-binding GntR family transcriptional regulator [Saccharopolyspora lacisalsi]|uniref:DNA-binding GntR family transcriptional regulator n=1 Tax=Halosaccharopolyspora lacisalsi TaxID=1000566 RepID=A0A839DRZ1_9PSEU|nr:GntR family transcriptional regulator [Halosaccharopolyspora lacisalsi]MBA8824762.1 DNA-binding GntR family transcriptional regulator [Halosaccharopolyspora lacisalsi]
MTTTGTWVDQLAADRSLLDRASTAERVAEVLRQRIIEGVLAPGTRLSEESAGRALAVSRNTLREAFRLLAHEQLLVHELHRGVFVRVLSADDVVDLYRMRRLLETGAVRHAAQAGPELLAAVEEAVGAGERAAEAERWWEVGTANMRFHQALAALASSPRVDETMRQLLAELRLAFHVMSRPREFHEPYLELNRVIAELIGAGKAHEAADRLDAYFDTAETQLVEAYRSYGS